MHHALRKYTIGKNMLANVTLRALEFLSALATFNATHGLVILEDSKINSIEHVLVKLLPNNRKT